MTDTIIFFLIISSLLLWRSFWYRNKYENPNASKEEAFFKSMRINVPINALFFISSKNEFAKKSNFYLRLFYILIFLTFIIICYYIFTNPNVYRR